MGVCEICGVRVCDEGVCGARCCGVEVCDAGVRNAGLCGVVDGVLGSFAEDKATLAGELLRLEPE